MQISFADARDLLGLTALFENNQIQKHANLTRYMTLIQGMAKLVDSFVYRYA